MIRWLMRVTLVAVLAITAFLGWLAVTASGARVLLQELLPAFVSGVAIESVDGTLWRGLNLRGLAYHDPNTRVAVDHIRWTWDLSRLQDRQLDVTGIELGHLAVELLGAGAGSQGGGGVVLPLSLHLPDVRVDSIEILQQGKKTLLSDIRANVDIDRRLQIHTLQLALAEPPLRLRADGEVALDDEAMPLKLRLDWKGELPQIGPASGSGRVEGTKAGLKLEHHLTEPYLLNTSGEVSGLDTARPGLQLEGGWKNLRWPLKGEPMVRSETGRYQLAGPLDALGLDLQGDLSPQQYPKGPLALKATVYPDRVQLVEATLHTTSGNLSASGAIDYDPVLRWQLKLKGTGIDAALLGEPWSGRLDLDADTVGRMSAEGASGSVKLHGLDGQLRGYPVAAQGEFLFAPNKVEVRDTRLSSGKARITLDGPIYPRFDFAVEAAVPDLGQLWPGLAGTLNGRGRVGGDLSNPQVNGNFKGEQLAFADLRADQLDMALAWPTAGREQGQSSVKVQGLSISDRHWETAELSLEGATKQHRLHAVLRGGIPDIELAVQGGWDGSTWRGEVRQVRLQRLGKGVWTNQAPASLVLGAAEARLAPFCLAQGTQSVCLEGGRKQAGSMDASVRIRSVDLANLAGLIPSEYTLRGRVDGEATLSGTPDQPSVKASLAPEDGSIRLQGLDQEGPLEVHYSNAHISLDYRDRKLAAEAELMLQEQARATLRLSTLPGKGQASDRLQGRVEVDLPDLQALTPLVPQARIHGGSAHLQATLGGTLEQPRVSGDMTLADTELEYPDLGLDLKAVELRLHSEGDTRIQIAGSATSGQGKLQLDGQVEMSPRANWPIDLHLRGDRVLAVRLPDTRVLVTPDLRIKGDSRELNLEGRVVIPEAAIVVRELPQGTVRPSEDEVVLGARQPEALAPGTRVHGKVELELGDKVSFSGFGLKTRLEGLLGLRFEPGQNLANGNIDLREGRYRAWGQDLSIEQGRLLFAGPVDNPGVDLRALRVSKDGQVKAYLEVGGTLRKPVSKVRTEPPTSSSDSLSYLLNGTALGESGGGMSQAQLLQAAGALGLEKTMPALQAIKQESGLDELGVDSEGGLEGSALVAGKYLSPDLYARYIQGLFDSSAILSLRYRLSNKLSVETRSGTTQSVELIYSFEHD